MSSDTTPGRNFTVRRIFLVFGLVFPLVGLFVWRILLGDADEMAFSSPVGRVVIWVHAAQWIPIGLIAAATSAFIAAMWGKLKIYVSVVAALAGAGVVLIPQAGPAYFDFHMKNTLIATVIAAILCHVLIVPIKRQPNE